jgi:hypothetical protein
MFACAAAAAPAGSFVPPVPAPPPAAGVQTRLQKGIRRPKKYTDDTVRYALLTSTQEEYDAFMVNNIWHLVPPSSNKNIINYKWVYRINTC